MSRQFKGKRKQEDLAPLLGPQAFLDAAHGFDTTNADCGKSTSFSTLVVKALNSDLAKPVELTKEFGIDVKKAKKGQSTGVSFANRERFITIMTERAVEKGGQPRSEM